MASAGIRVKALRPKPNYFFSILSVSLVLFLVGIFLFLSLHSGSFIRLYKEQINVIVEVKSDADEAQVKSLGAYLEGLEEVKSGSVTFISKDEGLQMLQQDMGENFLLADMPNPLFDVYTVHVQSEELDDRALQALREKVLEHEPVVSDVYYQESLYEAILQNLERMGYIILLVSLIIVFVAITLIHNVNKLALYSNRFLIRNMELVGASWSFIIRPFLRKSLWHGLSSALISLLMLAALIYLILRYVPEMAQVMTWQSLGTIAGVVIAGSIVLTVVSTWFVVNKYLRMRFNDLF